MPQLVGNMNIFVNTEIKQDNAARAIATNVSSKPKTRTSINI